jgi:hypothetical protein
MLSPPFANKKGRPPMLWRTRETPLALFIREEEFLNVQESERLTVSLLAA